MSHEKISPVKFLFSSLALWPGLLRQVNGQSADNPITCNIDPFCEGVVPGKISLDNITTTGQAAACAPSNLDGSDQLVRMHLGQTSFGNATAADCQAVNDSLWPTTLLPSTAPSNPSTANSNVPTISPSNRNWQNSPTRENGPFGQESTVGISLIFVLLGSGVVLGIYTLCALVECPENLRCCKKEDNAPQPPSENVTTSHVMQIKNKRPAPLELKTPKSESETKELPTVRQRILSPKKPSSGISQTR